MTRQSDKIKIQLKIKQQPTTTAPMTSVVCVKVKYLRPKYHDLKEWMADPNNVYIGRRGIVFIDGVRYPKEDSVWANPFKVGQHGTRDEVIQLYQQHIKQKMDSGEAQLSQLKGKTLGCWCKPDSCHGDYLVELCQR